MPNKADILDRAALLPQKLQKIIDEINEYNKEVPTIEDMRDKIIHKPGDNHPVVIKINDFENNLGEKLNSLDKLFEKLLALAEEKRQLLNEARERKAYIHTGHVKSEIHKSLPYDSIKEAIQLLIETYKKANKFSYLIFITYSQDDYFNRAYERTKMNPNVTMTLIEDRDFNNYKFCKIFNDNQYNYEGKINSDLFAPLAKERDEIKKGMNIYITSYESWNNKQIAWGSDSAKQRSERYTASASKIGLFSGNNTTTTNDKTNKAGPGKPGVKS